MHAQVVCERPVLILVVLVRLVAVLMFKYILSLLSHNVCLHSWCSCLNRMLSLFHTSQGSVGDWYDKITFKDLLVIVVAFYVFAVASDAACKAKVLLNHGITCE